MVKKKKELRMATNYFVNGVNCEDAERAVENIREDINIECPNPFCNGFLREKKSDYGISIVKNGGMGDCSIIFLSSEWCCKSFMETIHGNCLRGIHAELPSAKVVSKPNHFYQ